MKTIVIAAGYATRLYPLTENFPKPLLKIGPSSILGRMLDDIDTIDDIDEHIIVSNHKFSHHFNQWISECKLRKPVSVIDDGTSTNETRLGAVRDLLLAINQQQVDDDILVVAADNILNFSFQGFVDAVPPFYIYKRDDLALILDSLNHGCGFDAPGNLAHYLVDKTVIHAYEMPGERFDIGSLDTYQEAIKRFG